MYSKKARFFFPSFTITIAILVLVLILIACTDKGAAILHKKSFVLNDTGITWGGDYPKGINPDCTATIRSDLLAKSEKILGKFIDQQDCQSGLDRLAGNDKDGKAGFVYKKINAKGEFLSSSAKTWACVLDENSGLVWEVKEQGDGQFGNRGLHDADDRFTWYNTRPAVNGGSIGSWNAQADQCTGYTGGQPTTYCNIEEFVSRTNAFGLCNFRDWRVPRREELESLVNFGRTVPAIDERYFPNAQNDFYWTYSPVAGKNETAWGVNFQFGYAGPLRRDNARYVRLVRTWGGG